MHWFQTWLLLSCIFPAVTLEHEDIERSDSSSNYFEAPEPFRYLFGHCVDCNPPQPESPDPLVRTTWALDVNQSELQIYRVNHAIRYSVYPPNAIDGIESILDDSKDTEINILRNCTVFLDWGVERAAWLEFTMKPYPGRTSSSLRIDAAISEFNVPYPGKRKAVVGYGNHTFRLETNSELYEGIRFTWLYFNFSDIIEAENTSLRVGNISLVAKVKPVTYAGSYRSSDSILTRSWYTGAYGVRLNMEANDFNTVLIERGDRVAIQGDAHPTIAASLVAFAPFDLILHVLRRTDSEDHHVVDDSIMAYPLYWCLSVIDWYMASGDDASFRKLLPDVMKIVDTRVNDFMGPELNIVWMGWDDRLGNGWCNHADNDSCGREAELSFGGLVIRVCKDLAHTLAIAQFPLLAQKYRQISLSLSHRFRQVPEWPNKLGVHAAANAINAGIVPSSVIEDWMSTLFNDPVSICSWSPFNQYWILQALGKAGKMEHALASVKLCWGTMLQLGNGCFWELSSPEYLNFMKEGDPDPQQSSYCHPWSSGVTAWQSHVHGGIKPLFPGYKDVLIAPFISQRYPIVATTVPTPNGPVYVNATVYTNANGFVSSLIAVRSSGTGLLGLQKSLMLKQGCTCHLNNSHSIFVNGMVQLPLSVGEVVVFLTQKFSDELIGHFFEGLFKDDFVYIHLPEPGLFNVSAAYSRDSCIRNPISQDSETENEFYPFPKAIYSGSVLLDQESRGNGLLKHGSDGYLLVGYEKGKDRVELPNYIQNVTFHKHGYRTGWGEWERLFIGKSPTDPAFLPDLSVSRASRALGMIGHDYSTGGQLDSSILLEVSTHPSSDNHQFLLSIYCIAGKSKNLTQAFRVMNLSTLNVIAPTSVVSDDGRGVWWTLQYDASVRLRIENIQGVRVSAVAFARPSTNAIDEVLVPVPGSS